MQIDYTGSLLRIFKLCDTNAHGKALFRFWTHGDLAACVLDCSHGRLFAKCLRVFAV